MRKDLPIKFCRSHRPYCNARIKTKGRSRCCRYGWCGWAEPISTTDEAEFIVPFTKAQLRDIPNRDELIKEVIKFSKEKLNHLYQISEKDLDNCLDALVWYITEPEVVKDWKTHPHVHKAVEEVFKDTLTTMLQFQERGVGVRIEAWAL